MANDNTENGGVPIQIKITIPGNAGTGATLRSLCIAGGYEPVEECTMEIWKYAPGVDPGVDRGAFVVASTRRGSAIASTDFTTHGKPIAAGESYYVPSTRGLDNYVRGTTASTVDALVTIVQ